MTVQGAVKINRPNIGLKRISRSTPTDVAQATRQVRESMNDIVWNMQKVVNGLKDVTKDALLYGLQPIYDESQELVPVDTGALQASGYLEVQQNGEMVTAEVGYARGGIPDYAATVHEDLEVYHKPPTQAKYLEAAIDNNLDQLQPRVVDYMKRAMSL